MSGLIVPPEEPEQIAIRRALKDDALVDEAARINLSTAKERLDYVIKPQAVKIYQNIYEDRINDRTTQ
jgi:hypothetical protein